MKHKEKLDNDVIFGRKCSVHVIRHRSHSMEMIGQILYDMHNIVCIYITAVYVWKLCVIIYHNLVNSECQYQKPL